MATLARWVLAHKRMVVIFWLVLTLVGMASAGSATKALKQKFSVPGKEGWVTNQTIERDFKGTGGNGAPLLAVVTLPAGRSVDAPAVLSELRAVESRLERHAAGHAPGRLREHAQPGVPVRGPTHHVRDRLPATRPHAGLRRQPQSRRTRERGARRHDGRRGASAPDRL